MPAIFTSSDLTTTRHSGVAQTTLADAARLGTDALQVERLALDPGAHTLPRQASGAEHFLYVIRGTGQARVGSESFPLEPESVLWLEPGDTYIFEGGAETLEGLLCRAPASTPPPAPPPSPEPLAQERGEGWPSGRGGE